eukprot:CAMPEP_0201729082 /NCGR_PEP_ID=MMETSP0593-20130828/17924_1 /ASSEMBLY_ACC=CAM_ASM_000672 /TAXON_ID=267983 /ORGANISM="Skeletonema japonicum, Strain CCMP2506" /LENGTH=604 /DNA_ID=CAMNT_0048221359 /DNA_START=139 /DNA_END=1953 /DNA_ORIENTATION=-
MTQEMRETWIEVEADLDDKVRKQCVHDVLEVYGGGKFDPAWGKRGVPNSLKRSVSGKTERRSAAAAPEISTMLDDFRCDSSYLKKSVLTHGLTPNLGVYNYCPPEWNWLTPKAKKKLTHLLSLENLSKWGFDVFEVAELTRMTLTPEDKCINEDEEPSTSSRKREQFCPLLLVGWAILCSPMAQVAMNGSLEGYYNLRDDSGPRHRPSIECLVDSDHGTNHFHYTFDEHFKINPEAICNFLREIEGRYSTDTPYHNNVHAADVTQTLHALFAFIGKDLLYSISKPLEIFSLILAATFHDVGHPGTNNLFQKNAMTPFAVQYNDVSILENMHATVGHSILMGEEREDEWDVFKNWKQSQIVEAREIMIRAILGTDMSNHFLKMDELMEKIDSVRFTANIVLQSELGDDSVSEDEIHPSSRRSRDEKDQQQMLDMLSSPTSTEKLNKDSRKKEQPILDILAKVRQNSNVTGENSKTYAEFKTECRELSSSILVFLLHSADISNPGKPQALAVRWANKALAEFFAQGDKEKELALPVSPLCDKEATKTADSQIGFLQFVVRPLYILLGDIVPQVKEEVLPIVNSNLDYWQVEKKRASLLRQEREQLK